MLRHEVVCECGQLISGPTEEVLAALARAHATGAHGISLSDEAIAAISRLAPEPEVPTVQETAEA
jgi:hypothetical protein